MSTEVTIIMGSKSDQAIADKVKTVFTEFGIDYDVHIASAHRTPDLVKSIVKESTAKVFIAIAGLSAALPGVVAAHTTKPVIGVPVSGKVNFDSILSIVQMPPGIPVAAVGLDNGTNAALLTLEIMAINNSELSNKILEYRANARNKIISANQEL
jgi:5-(carboxyamino)imidazole ribonucleotide mutase